MEIPEQVKQFVITVRIKARQEENISIPSMKSVQKLIMTLTYGWRDEETKEILSEGLRNKDNRIPWLQAVTGLPILSQMSLTQGYTNVLINEIGEEVTDERRRNPSIVRQIEDLLESGIGSEVWNLFPWESPRVGMPPVQTGDSGGTGDARSSIEQG